MGESPWKFESSLRHQQPQGHHPSGLLFVRNPEVASMDLSGPSPKTGKVRMLQARPEKDVP